MEKLNPALAVYSRDSFLPYWQNNVCAESIFDAFSYGPERAQAWLRYRNVSETCSGFERAVMMHGRFEGGILGNHTYQWTFTPTYMGELAIVVPVYELARLVDMLAISRHDPDVWGCCTGAGQYVGRFVDSAHDRISPVTLRVHKEPIAWLTSGEGILPLAKSFFPLMQFAHNIVAHDGDHAWEIAHRAFVNPAERFGLDVHAAEQAAFDRISFAEEAA
jgi:hypothetical protein